VSFVPGELARADLVVIRMCHMTAKPRLSEFVPIRMSREHKVQLRRWARESRADVSTVVRSMIEAERQRRAREAELDSVATSAADVAA